MRTNQNSITFKLQTNKIELGIEVKDDIDEICGFIQPYNNHFLVDVEEKLQCSIVLKAVDLTNITFKVSGLDSELFFDLLSAFKKKLETKFNTGRVYYRVIEPGYKNNIKQEKFY